MTTMVLQPRDLAVELHGLLVDIDAVRLPADLRELHARLQRLIKAMASLLEAGSEASKSAVAHIAELREVALRYAPRDSTATAEALRRWREFSTQLRPAFARWLRDLRSQGVSLPAATARLATPTRPGNLLRNGFHVTNALVVIGLVQFVLTTPSLRIGAAIAGMTAAWTMEAARRWSPGINRFLMTLFARVAHPHESVEVNSATWYTTALVILAIGFPVDIGIMALAVLGFGDPAAAIIGRNFGRTPVGRGRTLEGSLAFVAAGALAAFGIGLWLHPAAFPVLALRALAGGVAGAVAEVVTRRLDDNLTIPLAVATVLGVLRLGGW
ncbi:MAG: hypothetical protein AAGA48_35430 [Myxococcota bacterium]